MSKIVVGSTSMSLSHTPATAADIVLTSIMGNTDIVGDLLNDAMSGINVVADSVYRYGRDHYTLGLPEGSMAGVQAVSDTVVKPIIEAELAQGVVIDYSFIGALDGNTVVLPFLYSQRGYSRTAATISVHPFTLTPDINESWGGTDIPNDQPVYVASVSIANTATAVTATIKYAHNYFVYTGEIVDGQSTRDVETVTEYFYDTVPVDPAHHVGEQYCITAYFLLDSQEAIIPGSYSLWFYRLATQVYPQLSVTGNTHFTNAFMPIVPIRYANRNLNEDATELTVTSKKLLKKMHIDMDSICDSLAENPDIADIDHAYAMFGIHANSTDQDDLYYLTEHFDYLADVQNYTKAVHDATVMAGVSILPYNIQAMFRFTAPSDDRDFISVMEHGLNMVVSFDYITSTIKNGVIGAKNFASKEIRLDYGTREVEYSYSSDHGGTYWQTVQYAKFKLIYRLQITDAQYKEVTIQNPGHSNSIYKTYAVITGCVDLLDPTNTNFIVPVHYGIARRVPLSIRKRMFNNSLVLVINSIEKIKTKWYQSSFFKFFVTAIAVIGAVFTVGQSTWLTGLTAAMGAGIGELGVFLAISGLKMLLTSIIMNYAFSFIAEALGVEFAAILGIVLAAAAVFGGFKGKLPIGSIAQIPTSQTLLTASQGLLSAANRMVTDALTAIQAELIEWQEEASVQMEELNKVTELLKPTTLLNPLDWVMSTQMAQVPNESPTDFYERTIHSGNVGVKVLDVIGNYHKLMLKLPEPDYI